MILIKYKNACLVLGFAWLTALFFHLFHHVHAFSDVAKNNMLAI